MTIADYVTLAKSGARSTTVVRGMLYADTYLNRVWIDPLGRTTDLDVDPKALSTQAESVLVAAAGLSWAVRDGDPDLRIGGPWISRYFRSEVEGVVVPSTVSPFPVMVESVGEVRLRVDAAGIPQFTVCGRCAHLISALDLLEILDCRGISDGDKVELLTNVRNRRSHW